MILVWFIYGLAFFALGLVILIYPKRGSRFRLARHIWMIGVFGVVHGANEWLDMFRAIGKPFPVESVDIARMFTLSVSFLFLLQFGVTIASQDAGRRRLVRLLPLGLVAAWIAVLWTSGPPRRLLMGDIWARYLLCAPGAFLTAWGLFSQTAEFRSMRLSSVAGNLTVAAAAFLVYGAVSGLIVREADFFPASMLNYRVFMAVAGFPPQVLRALCAIAAAGSIIRMLDVFRWETQENLRVSELRCATIASAMPVFLFMADRNLVITFVQGRGLEALGLSPEQIRGRHIGAVFPANEGLVENCRRALSGHEAVAMASVNGASFEVSCSSLRDAAGAVSHVVGVALDVSDEVKARQELDEYRRQMEKHARDAQVAALSAKMGGQIAEPLSVARLTLEKALGEISQAGGSPEAVRHAVARGLSEIVKAGEVLGQFLNIAHPGSTAAGQPLDLYQIARRTAGVFAESAQRKGLTIAIREMDVVPVLAVAPREMEQIFYQLIQWVVDAPSPGPTHKLAIACSASDGHIELVFSSTDGGNQLQRTDVLDLPGLSGMDGMGLGLAIVQQIVATYQGRITMETPPGGGVVIRIRLPVTRVY
jgi:PAS domain S-box-containing protein